MTLKRNLLYNFILSASQIIFPLISIPYISRVLDPAGIGHVSFIDSLTYYFIVIAEFGITTYGIREVARNKKNKAALNKLVSELVSLHLMLSAITLILYSIAISFLYAEIGDWRLLLFSFSFLLMNAFTCEWYFWGMQHFKHITIRTLITRLLGLVALFLLVLQPDDYIIYYGIISITAIVNLAWNYFKMLSVVKINFNNLDWKKHFRFTKLTYLISLTYSVPLLLDNVLLGLISTSAAVAYYAFAIKIMRMSCALITDSFLVLYPQTVSLIEEKESTKIKQMGSTSFGVVFLFSIPICVGTFFLAEDFTALYFGDDFKAVAFNLQLLSIFPVLKSLSLFLNKQFLMPYDLDKLVLKGLLLGMIVYLVTAIILCYYFGSEGACIALLISEAVVLLCNIYLHKKTQRVYLHLTGGMCGR